MTDEHKEDCPHCGEDISETIHGLKTALEKTRTERDKYKNAAKEKDGPTKEELETSEAEKSKLQQDIESLTTELEASKAQTAELQEEATTGKIAAAVTKHGGNLKMLSPMIKAELASNPDLDLDEHIAALKNDGEVAGAFKASDHSGGGSDAGAGRDHITSQMTQTANLRRSQMTDAEKNQFQKTFGLDALLDLPL